MIDHFTEGIWFRARPEVGIAFFWGAMAQPLAKRWGVNFQLFNWRIEFSIARRID